MYDSQAKTAGLQTATNYSLASFGHYVHRYAVWTLEIAFPIRGSATHGGLLDANVNEPALQVIAQ